MTCIFFGIGEFGFEEPQATVGSSKVIKVSENKE